MRRGGPDVPSYRAGVSDAPAAGTPKISCCRASIWSLKPHCRMLARCAPRPTSETSCGGWQYRTNRYCLKQPSSATSLASLVRRCPSNREPSAFFYRFDAQVKSRCVENSLGVRIVHFFRPRMKPSDRLAQAVVIPASILVSVHLPHPPQSLHTTNSPAHHAPPQTHDITRLV